MTVRDPELFVRRPIPPGGTQELGDWKAECLSLGPGAIAVFLRALEYGSELEQYASLLGLRFHGYEISAEDDEAGVAGDLVYRLREPDGAQSRVVVPRVKRSAANPGRG
jgi:hypothetical protein